MAPLLYFFTIQCGVFVGFLTYSGLAVYQIVEVRRQLVVWWQHSSSLG